MLGCSRPLTAQVDELPLFGPGLSGGDDPDGDLEAGRRPSGISKPDRRTKHPCFGPRPCVIYLNMKTAQPGERKSGVTGKCGSVRVVLGVRRIIQSTKKKDNPTT